MLPTISLQESFYQPTPSLKAAGVQYVNKELLFTLNSSQPNDAIFVSMNYPYTYTRILKLLESQPTSLLCETPLGYKNHFLRIGAITSPKFKIICIARQHPGETVSSYVMEGFLKFILSDSIESQWLKRNCEVIVVPMVNIDGVQLGNFRCDIFGSDLNRVWKGGQHPIISEIKKLIREEGVKYFFDLHGHSKKKNTFSYGCRKER